MATDVETTRATRGTRDQGIGATDGAPPDRRRASGARQGGARRGAALEPRRVRARRPHRPDPVALLESQAESRVPELVPIRYGRMLVSPFTFYRGAALIMASDLAGTPRSGLTVQLCGDAHLSNFGVFASPERRMVFDLNDFDETLPGPWEWDVKRLAVSMVVRRPGQRVHRQAAEQGRRSRRSAPTGWRCGSSPACGTSTSGTRTSTSRPRSRGCAASSPRSRCGAPSKTWPRRAPRTACTRSPS